MKNSVDVQVSDRTLKSLAAVQVRTDAPSLGEMMEAIVEDWLQRRKLLLRG